MRIRLAQGVSIVALIALAVCSGSAWGADAGLKKKAAPAKTTAAAAAKASDPLIAAVDAAVKAGDAGAVQAANAALTAARSAYPAWVQDKTQAASIVAPDKSRALGMWNKLHQAALEADAKGDAARALDTAGRAVPVARDNLGEGHMATLVSLADLAAIEAKAGKIEEAETAYKQAITSAEASLGQGHPEAVKYRDALAELELQQIKFTDALALYQDTEAQVVKAFGADHPLALSVALDRARAVLLTGQGDAAIKDLTANIAGWRKTYGTYHPDLAKALAALSDADVLLGNYEAALAQSTEAEAILRANGLDKSPAGLAVRVSLGILSHKRGDLAGARQRLESAVTDAKGASNVMAELSAKAALVEVLSDQGDEDAALELGTEVFETRTKVQGPAHPDRLAALSALGAVYRKQGRLYEAEQAFDEAYSHYRKVLGETHPATIIAANNLGEILEKEGIFDRAEPYLRTASDASRAAYGDANPTTLASLNNLALLYESQGLFDKAEPVYKGVIAVQAKADGPRNAETVASVNNLAYLYMLEGDYPKAADMFTQVLAGWEKAYGPRHINTLKALNSLARAHHRMGKVAEAEKEFDRALSARKALLGDQHLDVLRSQIDLAALYWTTKRLDQAKALLVRTWATALDVLGPEHPYTFEAANALAGVLYDKGETAEALKIRHDIFRRRNAFLDRVLYVTGANAREGYIRLYQPELAAYTAQLAHMPGEAGARGVLEVSLARKGLLLKIASELAQVGRLSRDPQLAQIGGELIATRKRLAALTLAGPTPETKTTHVATLAALSDHIGVLEGDLGRASERFRKSSTPADLPKLEAALPKDAGLVDFLIYGEEGTSTLVASVLTWDGDKPVYTLVHYPDLAAINAAVVKYRTDIQSEELDIADLQDSGQAVYDLIWGPLDAALGKRSKVYVVPDGMLNILPFAALVTKDGKYLIEKVDMYVMGSSRDLLPSQIPAAHGGTIIDAGPDYNTDAPAGKDELEKVKRRSATIRQDTDADEGISRGGAVQGELRGMASGMRGLHFDPLPGAEREGQLIQKALVGDDLQNQSSSVTIFSKGEAQEKSLRNLDQPPEYLHIATHGFFLKADDSLRKRLLSLQRGSDVQIPPPGDNPLLRAGLAFAGINANASVLGEIDTDNDGVLTALEVLGLDLSGTKLAVLSACETGLGEIHEGEGVYGLRRAFQEAGVTTIVSSLWEVSDAGTQTLMTSFYKRLLAGAQPHQALRDAQIEMLRKPDWSAPYIWSAFFMVGG